MYVSGVFTKEEMRKHNFNFYFATKISDYLVLFLICSCVSVYVPVCCLYMSAHIYVYLYTLLCSCSPYSGMIFQLALCIR